MNLPGMNELHCGVFISVNFLTVCCQFFVNEFGRLIMVFLPLNGRLLYWFPVLFGQCLEINTYMSPSVNVLQLTPKDGKMFARHA